MIAIAKTISPWKLKTKSCRKVKFSHRISTPFLAGGPMRYQHLDLNLLVALDVLLDEQNITAPRAGCI
jgi:hypothetical protein